MSQTNGCPVCGAELPTGETEGLCPKCLMGAGLESQDNPGGEARATTTRATGSFHPPEPTDLAPHFPQLEIEELLGHGGMGAVYKARQTQLDRPVALKIIKPGSADDPAFAERFNREAKTLARLNHPNIVAVHDFGEAAGLYYFIMEYVDGANLRQLLVGQSLQPEQALAVVPQICEALQFAHDEGIVHRDIKPENILLDRKGRIKIADFGLAKLTGGSADDFTLTGTHQVLGTPRYMAPEQMEGSPQIDHRADIYSLGVVFYEMMTGELPMGRFEPPSQKVQVDVRIDEVVFRALERAPERRYQCAGEIKTDVEGIISGAQHSLGDYHSRSRFRSRAEEESRLVKPVPSIEASPDQGRAGALALTMCHCVLWMGLLIALLFVVPAFKTMFEEFALELPAISQLLCWVSDVVVAYWPLIVLLGIAAMALDFFILQVLGKTGGMTQSVAAVLLALVPLLLGGFVLVGICMPLTSLVAGLS